MRKTAQQRPRTRTEAVLSAVTNDINSIAEEMEAACRREAAAWAAAGDWDGDDPNSEVCRAKAASKEIIDRIIAAPVRTLDDCRLKARAYVWCHGDGSLKALDDLRDNMRTTDEMVIHALMRGLLTSAAKPDVGTRVRAPHVPLDQRRTARRCSASSPE